MRKNGHDAPPPTYVGCVERFVRARAHHFCPVARRLRTAHCHRAYCAGQKHTRHGCISRTWRSAAAQAPTIPAYVIGSGRAITIA